MTWNPDQYLKFGGDRARPALDLIARIPLLDPARIVDIGCGPGNVTAVLRDRWPDAHLAGLDSSPEMLAKAKADYPDIAWIEDDLMTWRGAPAPDLIFSNAVLQWLPDQAAAYRHLFDQLAPGGVLAVQVPAVADAPWRVCLDRLRADPAWADVASGLERTYPTPTLEALHGLFAGEAESLDIWSTTYLHLLDGDDPIVAWTSSTSLKPILAALADASTRREAFLAAFRACTAETYKRGADGRTPFPFQRRFLVARKASEPL